MVDRSGCIRDAVIVGVSLFILSAVVWVDAITKWLWTGLTRL